LIEDQDTSLTVNFDLDEPAPESGLKVFVDSDVEQIVSRLDLPGFAFNPVAENINPSLLGTSFDNSGFYLTIDEGATSGSFTINVFDNSEPDTFLPETFDGLVEANFSLVSPGEVEPEDLGDVGTLGDYTIDPDGATSTVLFADEESQLISEPEPPEPPTSDALQVSLFTGPEYLIENEGTVSAHAFNVTNGVIPEEGLVVSVDAPNLSEFDLTGVSVEGGEIVAVRDGGFDLRMTEYTTLVNLAIADDGETESGETATFSLAAGDGYEIVEDYSGGTFNLVDTASEIPQGAISEPNDIIPLATETQISPENPTFSGEDSIYFDIGNRYLNPDGTYTYIDYSEDVDLYKVTLNAGETIAIETFEGEGNPNGWERGIELASQIFDAEGNAVRDYSVSGFRLDPAAPDKLFGGLNYLDENNTDTYQEFTAPEDGDYYIGFGILYNVAKFYAEAFGEEYDLSPYDPLTPGSGSGNRSMFGNYGIEIDLLTEDNPRQTGTPTPPVSNPNVINPPTLTLTANPFNIDSEGNLTNAVVEYAEVDSLSGVNFTIETEGEIPEGGIEFFLNSDANLFDYVSLYSQNDLPVTFGGQSLGAFYNEEGIPTGIRLRIEEPTMTVSLETADNRSWFPSHFGNIIEAYEPLETDGAEDVTFFLQPGEGYEIAPDSETEVTYYDSIEDVPASTGGGSDIVPEVGVTVSETELIETEATETTVTFTLSEAPPPEGVIVYIDSEDDTLIGSPLSQFAVLEAEISGGNFPVPNADSSGFYFTITEQTATVTLSAFDELSLGLDLPTETFQEGIVNLNFALQPQAGYTIDPDASEINFTIADNPDSQIQVNLEGSIQNGESTTLIESEGTVSVHTFSLSAPPPEEGLTISVSTDSLDDFDLDAIEVTGGTVAEVRDDGFDLTITEQTATISLPVLDDGVSEGSETATFTLEPSDTYEINQAATEATFTLVETLDQVAVAEEVESNDTLPEANTLGLNLDNPSVSLGGEIRMGYEDRSEDVDLYSFNLDAGQTINLDIDTEEVLPEVLDFRPIVFPALEETLQKPDTELRLFDAEGNELAANNDGAAPDEDFSRDPFLEFTAETAGTYYVGVSQLGNRNYDPFTVRSGSGWTFPEVGVYFGPYELTASLTEGGTGSEIIGTDDNETLDGNAGDNLVAGLLGDDTVFGSDGDDTLRGDLNSRSPGGSVGGDDVISGGAGNDQIGGKAGNDLLSGDAGDDEIWGDAGNDTIMGVTGNDTLTGDDFSGGSGSDLFVFGNGDGTDTITDFDVTEDLIGLVEGELMFEDIAIADSDMGAMISVIETGETLAILSGVDSDELTSELFTITPDVTFG